MSHCYYFAPWFYKILYIFVGLLACDSIALHVECISNLYIAFFFLNDTKKMKMSEEIQEKEKLSFHLSDKLSKALSLYERKKYVILLFSRVLR